MIVEIKNNRINISLKLRKKPTPSKSGKTLLVASTRGVMPSKIKIRGRRVRVSANAFIDTDAPHHEPKDYEK